ncbi:MAG: lytic transglycosylase domain-containing protein [Nitrospirota bacterium]
MPLPDLKKIFMLQVAALPILLFLASHTAFADIYKYVDNSGVIVFTNVPRADQRKIETVVRERHEVPKKTPAYAPKKAPPTKIARISGSKPPHKIYGRRGDELPGRVPYSHIINAKCEKYGVDPNLVRSIIKAESNFNPSAVSPKGALGLMQLMPSTAADMGVRKILDPAQNIDGGVKYLRYLLDCFRGDVELSVAAYNCGQGRVIRNGMCVPEIPETKNYVRKVMRLSRNPVTGTNYSRPIYKVEMKDGSILFTETPVPSSSDKNISLAE